MKNGKGVQLQLPSIVPGTAEELAAIALIVVGKGSFSATHTDKARIKRVAYGLSSIAFTLLEGLHQQIASPTAKELETDLETILRNARDLVDKISKLPFFVVKMMDDRFDKLRYSQSTIGDAFEGFRAITSPMTAATAIEQIVEWQLAEWRDGTLLGRNPPNRPGPQRASQRIIGDPRALLASRVARLIADEQGNKAVTSDEKGSVYEVVERLWTYATGLPEQGANLRKYIRHGVRNTVFHLPNIPYEVRPRNKRLIMSEQITRAFVEEQSAKFRAD